MTKQKLAVVVGVPFVAIVLVVGGFMIGHGSLVGKKVASIESSDSSSGVATNNVVPLGGDQPAATSGGLSVSTASGGASSLGQLDSSQKQGSTSGPASSGSSGASAASNEPNPATFADYDKYKDQAHALFGEIVKGTGDELVANKKAAIYYKGWLTDGQLFDQSKTNASGQKQPLIFTLGSHEVVPGMEEGTLGMKTGGKRLIIIPPAVGYGDSANGPVPAHSLMVFEVELVAVQ